MAYLDLSNYWDEHEIDDEEFTNQVRFLVDSCKKDISKGIAKVSIPNESGTSSFLCAKEAAYKLKSLGLIDNVIIDSNSSMMSINMYCKELSVNNTSDLIKIISGSFSFGISMTSGLVCINADYKISDNYFLQTGETDVLL